MDCLDTLNQICEALGEDINCPLCKEIEEHLRNCPKCHAQVDSIRKVVHLYQEQQRSEVPQDIDDRLWKVLNLQRPND